MEIVSNKSGNNTYQYNTFRECEGTLTLRHGDSCTVNGNFFFGNNKENTAGVRVVGEDHRVFNNYFQDLNGDMDWRQAIVLATGETDPELKGYAQVKRALVAFNTMVNCYTNIGIGENGNPEEPQDCSIANNIVVSHTQEELIDVSLTPTNMTWEGNILWGSDLGDMPASGYTNVDPELSLSVSDGWYEITANSPAVDSAVGSSFMKTDSTDIEGQSRLNPDVGADEYSTETATHAPLVFGDVGAPYLSVTSPNGGEAWQAGSIHEVTWSSNGTNGNVKIEYSIDNGSNWTTVIASTTDDGSYDWTIPDTLSDSALVQISDTDGSLGGLSCDVFTISSITITSPNDGTVFNQGSDILITADASDGDNGTVTKVEFFADDSKLGEDTTAPYSFTWTNAAIGNHTLTAIATDNDNATTTSAAVNVIVQSVFTVDFASEDLYFETENYFSIGDHWLEKSDSVAFGGAFMENDPDAEKNDPGSYLKYTLNVSNGGNINVWILGRGPDDGSNSVKVNIDGSLDTTDFHYNPPDMPWQWVEKNLTINSGTVVFTIFNREPGAQIDRVFLTKGNSVPPLLPEISVTSPNGGEDWQVDSDQEITWTSDGTSGNVKIEYSIDNGSNWTTVIASTTDDGYYDWTTPNTPTVNALVRISDTDGNPLDQSDVFLTISVPAYSFKVERTTGDVFTAGSFIGGGADLAERINVSEPVEFGDVVELDPHKPEHYRRARGSSQLIAGVITTAPGFTLGNSLKEVDVKTAQHLKALLRNRPMLALMGRVPVKVTTENGAIRAGDLLTVSGKPGYAMRCAATNECEKNIVGKALENLKNEEGMILVLVMVR